MDEFQLMDTLDKIKEYIDATNDKERYADLYDRINDEFDRRDRIYKAEDDATKNLDGALKPMKLATKAMAKLTAPTEKNLQRKLKIRKNLEEQISYLSEARDELKEALKA